MAHPRVSIIVNCLNGEKYLRQALDSIFAQSYEDWEVIFWDNLSTDKSVEIAGSYGDRVRCFKSPTTYPLGKARNLAIEKANGSYIAFLDCDDIWLPQKLEKQMVLFECDPQVALVFCDVIFFDGKNDIYQLMAKYKPPRGMIFRELLAKFYIGFLSAVIRKSAVEGVEWFDGRFNNIEDADLFFRIAYSNKLDYVDEPLVKWRLHDSSQTFKKFELFASEREILIEKLAGLYPDFKQKYGQEIKIYIIKTLQFKTLGEWLNHRPASARRIIVKSGFNNILRCGLYCLTFFPPGIFFSLNKLRFRLKNLIG